MVKHEKNRVIVLKQELVKSAVWIGLSSTAKAVFLLFRCKCRYEKLQGRKYHKREPTLVNNGELVFTYREAWKEYNMTAPRFRRALDELIAKGFIDIAHTGMGVHKVTTHYGISERWRYYGTSHFVELKRPKRSKGYPGFRRGNELYKRRLKKKSTDKNVHGATDKNVHGAIIAMHTNVSGEKVKILYKWRKHKWLSSQIA